MVFGRGFQADRGDDIKTSLELTISKL